MNRREFLIRARIDSDAFDVCVDAGWLVPGGAKGEQTFSEIDLARTQLIQDLRDDFGVNDEGVPIILGLIDQLHGLRRALAELLAAVRAQPASTREHFAADLRAVRLQGDGFATLEKDATSSRRLS